MPSHDIHERVDVAVLGQEHPDVHDFLDLTARSTGPNHRGDDIHTTEAALAFAAISGEFRKAQSGLLHILTDELANHPELLEDILGAPPENHTERLDEFGVDDGVDIADITMERLGAFALDLDRQTDDGIRPQYQISENIADVVDSILSKVSEIEIKDSKSSFLYDPDTRAFYNEEASVVEVARRVVHGVAQSRGFSENEIEDLLGSVLEGTGTIRDDDDNIRTYKFNIHVLDDQDVISVENL